MLVTLKRPYILCKVRGIIFYFTWYQFRRRSFFERPNEAFDISLFRDSETNNDRLCASERVTTIATNALIVFTKFCAQVLLAQNLGLDRNGQNRLKCGGRFEYSVTVCLKRFTILENQWNRIKAGKNLHNFDSFCYLYTLNCNVFVINKVTQ